MKPITNIIDIILFISLIFITFSCDQTRKTDPNYKTFWNNDYEKHIENIVDTLKIRTDSIFFGFKFGMNNQELNDKIKGLQEKEIFGEYSSRVINVGSEQFILNGYPYKLYVGTKVYESMVYFYSPENKLIKIMISVYNTDYYFIENLTNIYLSKYGPEIHIIDDYSTYFISKDLEIEMETFELQDNIIISYTNIFYKVEKLKRRKAEERRMDSINLIEARKSKDAL